MINKLKLTTTIFFMSFCILSLNGIGQVAKKTPSKSSNALAMSAAKQPSKITNDIQKIGPKYPFKSYKIGPKYDTLNAIGANDLKYGKWVTVYPPLRGEPGYDEEGEYIESKKNGVCRKYQSNGGELLAYENYRLDCKHGQCFYYNAIGDLLREEMWKGFDPKHPYDTIAIYGSGNGNILNYKIILAKPYSVKNGTWNYYDTETGRIIKSVEYEINNIKGRNGTEEEKYETLKKYETPKDKEKLKPQAAKDWDKKTNKKKKAKIIEGGTGI